ncbi:MAG: HpcH/HpaI aldolase/citrate lyase family protein [Bacteroidales bacterium]|nr:HpcH/HpaI aldolase/citrate lyase family protein [Bacteroidales bacterium]MBN2756460.1 HpcH/HpaI aldolase/citrate lyase family protein [Bacteroidales bacterium]
MEKQNKQISVGNLGPKVRSDCMVNFELANTGGIQINLISKVTPLYGDTIKSLCLKQLEFHNIENAILNIEDKGALDFVISARLEYAIKQLTNSDKDFLLDIIEENKSHSSKEKFRFSRLYLPGNTPSMMLNAGIHKPNGIILDLEDAVALEKKEEARYLVRNALRNVDFYGAERMVRINQLPLGIEDLKFIVPHHVNLILIPKCESADQIHQVEIEINRIKAAENLNYPIYYMPIIESALGVEKSFEIATATENVVSMAIGLEDFTADLGVRRTKEGNESFYARTRIVNACKAAGIQPIDSVFSDIADMEALAENVKTSKSLGFEGMGCIHPRQIAVIHENFAPEKTEIEKATNIILAFDEAKSKGLGVVSLGTKMIDAPVVKRAEKTINLAIKLGILDENWKKIELKI